VSGLIAKMKSKSKPLVYAAAVGAKASPSLSPSVAAGLVQNNNYKNLFALLKQDGKVAREAWGVLDELPPPEDYIECVLTFKQTLAISMNPHHTLNALYGVRIFLDAFE